MPRPREPASPFRYFNSSPEVIQIVVLMGSVKPMYRLDREPCRVDDFGKSSAASLLGIFRGWLSVAP